ncbi:hypothetical protein [Rahnella selenatireducens]|uniref:hypothetical protein n=1 Tax=Rahnella selenatireducens TaxID=3389797 RepID=UPI0039687657
MLIDMLFSALQFYLHIKQNNNDLFLIIDHLMQIRKRKTHLYLNFYCSAHSRLLPEVGILRDSRAPSGRQHSAYSLSGGRVAHLSDRSGIPTGTYPDGMTGYAIINYAIDG